MHPTHTLVEGKQAEEVELLPVVAVFSEHQNLELQNHQKRSNLDGHHHLDLNSQAVASPLLNPFLLFYNRLYCRSLYNPIFYYLEH